MKRKIIFTYKKNGLFNQARISLDKQIASFLGVNENNKTITILFENGILYLMKNKVTIEETKNDENGNLLKMIKNVNFTKAIVNSKKGYWGYNLNIPSKVVKALKVGEDGIINILKLDDKVIIKAGEKMSKVYTVKNNKGGVGKSFVTAQLGAGLALMGYKTLMATSDSQNNILYYTMKKEEIEKYNMCRGLRHAVLFGDSEDLYIPIRKNLDFIPTESSIFTDKFEKKFEEWIEQKKEDYDYILIDSIPTMGIDKKFVELSDKIIIPTFCDYSTTEGILKVIEEAGAEKILAVLVNLYKNTKIQKEYLDRLKGYLTNTGICFPEPIKELSQIETLLEKGKTIWESKAKILEEAQKSFLDVILFMEK